MILHTILSMMHPLSLYRKDKYISKCAFSKKTWNIPVIPKHFWFVYLVGVGWDGQIVKHINSYPILFDSL